jgi:hypothetical protein
MMHNPVNFPQQKYNKRGANQPQSKNNPNKPTIIHQTLQSQTPNPNKTSEQSTKTL